MECSSQASAARRSLVSRKIAIDLDRHVAGPARQTPGLDVEGAVLARNLYRKRGLATALGEKLKSSVTAST